MSEAFHRFILSRLDATPAPIVRLRELLSHPEPAWRALIHAGVLVKTDTPELIEAASGRSLRVVPSGDQWIGLDEAERFPSPEPLTSEDVVEYDVAIPALLAHLRRLNAIDGRDAAPTGNLHPLGRKQFAGGPLAQVWLALALGHTDTITAQLAMLAQDQAHTKHLVIFPRWPELPPATMTAQARSGVLLADLDPVNLSIRWPAELQTEAASALPDYAILNVGKKWHIRFAGAETFVDDSYGMATIGLLADTNPADGGWYPLELLNGQRTSDTGVKWALAEGLSTSSHPNRDMPRLTSGVAHDILAKGASLQREADALREEGKEADAAEVEKELEEHRATHSDTVGLHGRSRMDGEAENARLTVHGNLDRALDAIEAENPAISRAIRERIIRSAPLSFNPEPGEVWIVRLPKKIRTSRPKSHS